LSVYTQVGGSRRIQREFNRLIGKRVEVELVSGKIYRGTLREVDYPQLNILLTDAITVGQEGKRIPLLLLSGSVVAELRAEEASAFDAREFAEYLAKRLAIRPDSIRVIHDANVVLVYNSIRVSEHGVEGSGSLAAKINYILKEYLEAKKRGEQTA
jgi:small nuclear ribonucleoprotein (snRNP)-like protein